ncbi:MAG TPA: molybdopterin dinucleotide binding domain-containing protein, partial [Geobacteraceae bacterium]
AARAAAVPFQSYPEMLKGTMKKRLGPARGEDFEVTWFELLRQGGLFAAGKSGIEAYGWAPGATLPQPQEPRFAGDEKLYPFHLQVYPALAFHDGRGAPLPWLQQLPDPMTTAVWGSWIEINPATAAKLGIAFGDLVEVASPQGSLRLPAFLYPGIRPDMVAIPLGQGHRDAGRYARGRGVNPLALLALLHTGSEPQAAWHATRVKITRISGKGELVTAGHPQGSFRSELVEI